MKHVTAEGYLSVVDTLAKPGADIVAQLTPGAAHLVHMSGCLLDEVARELSAGWGKRAEVVEEGGDARFYLVGIYKEIARELGLSPVLPIIGEAWVWSSDDSVPYASLVQLAGKLWDLIKRPCLLGKYPKNSDKLEMTRTEWLHTVLALCGKLHIALVASMQQACRANHAARDGWAMITDQELVDANVEKLCSGPNARYKDGIYSDDACAARADKADQVDDTVHA